MAKLYYWRHCRAAHNTNTLYVVFTNRDNRNGLAGYVKPIPNSGWEYLIIKPGKEIKGEEETQQLAMAKVEESINREFQPEYMPYFG